MLVTAFFIGALVVFVAGVSIAEVWLDRRQRLIERRRTRLRAIK